MFNYPVREKRVLIGDIPALIIEADSSEDLAWVIHYHGWGSKKENHRLMASSLAASGFRVLVPDSLYHGERLEEREMDFLPQVLLANLGEFDDLVSYLGTKRVLLSGHSMGAMSAGLILHHKNKAQAAVVINGYLTYRDQEMDIGQELKGLDPLDYLENVQDKSLLILHGTRDDVVDIEVQRDYFKKARGAFRPGHLLMEEIEGVGHFVSLSMLEKTIEFFKSV